MTNPYRSPERSEPDPIEPVQLPMPGHSKWLDERWMQLFLVALGGASVHSVDLGEDAIVSSAERVADAAWRRMHDAGAVQPLI